MEKRTLDVLLDKAPKGINHIVLESISGLEGVDRAHDVRVRNVGTEIFIDLHIEVPRTSTNDKAHKIATNVENKIRKIIPNSDVLVHVDAIESESETLTDIIRLIASETNGIKNVHSIYFSQLPSFSNKQPEKRFHETNLNEGNYNDFIDNKISKEFRSKNINSNRLLHLYLDVQVDSGLDLMSAHNIIETFESKVKKEIPVIQHITTHIEFETEEIKTIGIEKEVNSSRYDFFPPTAPNRPVHLLVPFVLLSACTRRPSSGSTPTTRTCSPALSSSTPAPSVCSRSTGSRRPRCASSRSQGNGACTRRTT